MKFMSVTKDPGFVPFFCSAILIFMLLSLMVVGLLLPLHTTTTSEKRKEKESMASDRFPHTYF
jgi:hypothetical protein